MDIKKSEFQLDDIERFGSGAGIILLSKAPTGEFHALLGRERFLPSWKGSCRWSGFEGSRKASETLVDTAIREFVEESLGVVLGRAAVEHLIESKSYWLRVVLQITNDRRAERYHSTYVLHIPWDDTYPQRFSETRGRIEHMDRLVKEMERSCPVFAVEDDPAIELGDVLDGKGCVVLERFIPPEWNTCETQSTGADDEEDRLRWVSEEEGKEVMTIPHTHPYASRVKAWEAVRSQIERLSVSHNAIEIRYGKRSNRVQSARVSTDYLEKDEMRWWPVSDLRRVLDMRGYIGTDCFRPYFLPVLQTVLHELTNEEPECIELPPGNDQ